MLKQLSEAFGVSGDEQEVRGLIRNSIEPHVDRIFEDGPGNLYAVKGKRGKKIMLLAHTDEVGLMVVGIERSGLLRFKTVGGIDARVLPGKPVLVTRDRIPGAIGTKPPHLCKPDEIAKRLSIDSLFIDIGASSKEEAEKQVHPGDYAIFDTQFKKNGDIMIGKAFDDRLGCYLLTQLLKKNFDAQIIAVFTVQEEIGTRGAKIAAYRMHPDCALAIEVTSTNDLPRRPEPDRSREPYLRKGPVVTVADLTLISDRGLLNAITQSADEHRIPYQFKPPMIGGTDAGTVHLQRGGIKSAVISCPVRYIHSPCSVASYTDLDHAGKLLPHVIRKIIEEVKCN